MVVWVGISFERLTIVEELPGSRIICACSCGETKTISKTNWKHQKSCGCLKKELHEKYLQTMRKTPEELKTADARRGEKYRATAKFKETRKKYDASPAGKANRNKWHKSDKCKEANQLRITSGRASRDGRKYYGSPKGQLSAKNKAARRRGAVISGDLTEVVWKKIVSEWGDSCAYCKQSVKLTMEHVIPICHGGEHTKSNVVPACGPCNYGRAHRSLEEFFSKNGLCFDTFKKRREQVNCNV